MNPVQHERLQNLIAQSPLLTPTERAEWASLLVVMNDKQIAELEQILLSPAEAAPQPATPARPPHLQAQPLPPDQPPVIMPKPASASHARVPFSGVIMNPPRVGGPPDPQPSFDAVPVKHKPEPVAPTTTTAASVLPPVQPKPMQPQPASVPMPSAVPTSSAAPTVAPVAAKNNPAAVVEVAVPLAPASEAPHLENFATLADVAKLSLSYFRSHLAGELQQQLRQLVADYDYFTVRAELEKSPLFHTYIQSGLLLLSGQQLSQQFLSRQEWETMADLLASIRRN